METGIDLAKSGADKTVLTLDGVPLPQYQCHKKVWALKIAEIHHNTNPDSTGKSGASSYGAKLVPEDKRYGVIDVDASYMTKHPAEVGGYFVIYEDGYKSYSPAPVFESGYTLIE